MGLLLPRVLPRIHKYAARGVTKAADSVREPSCLLSVAPNSFSSNQAGKLCASQAIPAHEFSPVLPYSGLRMYTEIKEMLYCR